MLEFQALKPHAGAFHMCFDNVSLRRVTMNQVVIRHTIPLGSGAS